MGKPYPCCQCSCLPCSYSDWYGMGCTWNSYPGAIASFLNGTVMDFGVISDIGGGVYESSVVDVGYSDSFLLASTVYRFGAIFESHNVEYFIDNLKFKLRMGGLADCNPYLFLLMTMRVIAPSTVGSWDVTTPAQTIGFTNYYGTAAPPTSNSGRLVLTNCAESGNIKTAMHYQPWAVTKPTPDSADLWTNSIISVLAGNLPFTGSVGSTTFWAPGVDDSPPFLVQQATAFDPC